MIKLIKRYPYDNSYNFIKLFETQTQQNNFFNSFNYILIDEGEEEGYIKQGDSFIVDYNFDYLVNENINYVIWNNGHKNLFCFIIEKQYVDENLTRLIYEIDVLNTFCFDFTFENSFIERKDCNINEISDFDEGLYLGEHEIKEQMCSLEKKYTWFAMFNGIKQQEIIFDNNGNLQDVINLPQPTMKPNTTIDNIYYPIHFVPLQTTYKEPLISEIQKPSIGGGSTGGSVGDWEKGFVSADGFRFMKGYEGFAPYPYNDGYGYMTIGYGVTKHGEVDIYNQLLKEVPLSEERASKVGYDLKYKNYASPILKRCKYDLGITTQNQFDALVDLAFNCGYGVILQDNTLTNAIKSKNESAIRSAWENFKVTSSGIPSEGLRLRRKAQCDVFLLNVYEFRDIVKIDSDGTYNGVVTENNGHGWLPT